MPQQLQVDSAHYGASYEGRERYYSYVEQVLLARELKPRSVVEIGIGSGFVSRELRTHGIEVVTLDLDPALGPSATGSIERLPLRTGACDVAVCCQVLEHLPFERLEQCVRELFRVAGRAAIVSLPIVTTALRLEMARGFNPVRARRVFVNAAPWRKALPHSFDGQHHWEIGKLGFPLSAVEDKLRGAGFRLSRSYRLHLNPYHQFFVLEK